MRQANNPLSILILSRALIITMFYVLAVISSRGQVVLSLQTPRPRSFLAKWQMVLDYTAY